LFLYVKVDLETTAGAESILLQPPLLNVVLITVSLIR